MMQRLLMRVLLTAMVATAVSFAPSAASGRDAKDITLSPTQTPVTENYPALVASSPAPATVGTASHSPTQCRSAQYCDTIDLTLSVPRDYEYQWSIRLTVTWTASAATHDIDVYLYDINEGLLQSAATGGKPEVLLKGDLDPGLHYLVIVNFIGPPNDPYRVIGEFIQGKKIQQIKKPENPFRVIEQGGGGSGGSPPAFGGRVSPGTPGEGTLQGVGGSPTFEPIRVDTPEGLAPASGRRAPLATGGAGSSGVEINGRRMLSGLGLLALIGLFAYMLFFAPRRQMGPAKSIPAQ